MGSPLISIIMSTYNGERTLVRCINSILSQTYKNWELIICDDCSTDNTTQILNRYADKDDRIIILYNEKNRKLAFSLNRCLNCARGKYIARMDDDDESLPMRLYKQVDFLEKHKNIDVVGCNAIIFDSKGEVGIRKYGEYPTERVLLTGVPFMHPAIMMKKSVYDDLGGYTVCEKTNRGQDQELWFRFYQAGYNGYNIQEPLYKYSESLNDYNKRSLYSKYVTIFRVFDGYKKLKFKKWEYIFIVKYIIAMLIPNRIMKFYHDKKLLK